MEDNTNAPASGKEDNPQLDPKDLTDTGPAYPNNLNNREGTGSPYAGTQSQNPQAPDGLQIPKEEEGVDSEATPPAPETTGSEYGAADSYGHKGAADDRNKPGSDNMEESAPMR